MSAEPAYATARNPKNPSFGKRVAAVAAHLGTPLMPWQRTVADVITELDPANPGAWRYPLVVISVPRQAGKTALLRALLVDRMMCYRKHEILMTAQTGKDARKRWKQITTALDSKKKRTTSAPMKAGEVKNSNTSPPGHSSRLSRLPRNLFTATPCIA